MSEHIENVLHEARSFPPPLEFAQRARVSRAEYERLYRQSLDDPETFWTGVASDLHWSHPWTTVLQWNEPHARWFDGARTSIAYNALDRHLPGRANKPAVIFESETGDTRTLTYAELHAQVCQLAHALQQRGVTSGDRVTIYLPLVPEVTVAMLACARIGAVHSVVFGGFSSQALTERLNDAGSKVLITADGGNRKGQLVPLKHNADQALQSAPGVQHVIVLQHTRQDVSMQEGRDAWWHDAVHDQPAQHEAVMVDSEHPLFILYTSGSTGKPKGVLHTTGGYMVGAYLTT